MVMARYAHLGLYYPRPNELQYFITIQYTASENNPAFNRAGILNSLRRKDLILFTNLFSLSALGYQQYNRKVPVSQDFNIHFFIQQNDL